MKKIIAFALALLVSASMAACTYSNYVTPGVKQQTEQKKEEPRDEQQATNALKGFMNGIKNFDIVEVSEFCTTPLTDKAGYENLRNEINEAYENVFGDSVSKAVADELKVFVDSYIDGLSDGNEYVITKSEYKDGKWYFDITFNYMDHASFGDILLDETDKLRQEYTIKYFDDFAKAKDDKAAVLALTITVAGEVLADLKDVINDAAAKADKGTVTGTLVVVERDGKWLVDATGKDIDKYIDAIDAVKEAVEA